MPKSNRQGIFHFLEGCIKPPRKCVSLAVLLGLQGNMQLFLSVVVNRQGKHHFLECCCKPPRKTFKKNKYSFMIFSNDLGWRNDINQSCSNQKDLKLSHSNFFHLNSFRVSNMCYKIHQTKYKSIALTIRSQMISRCNGNHVTM